MLILLRCTICARGQFCIAEKFPCLGRSDQIKHPSLALWATIDEADSGDVEQAKAAFDDYVGYYTSLADFAESLTRETGPEIPETFQHYIDWSAMGQDMALNGDVFTIEMYFDEVHIF